MAPAVQEPAENPAPSKLKAAYASVEQAAKKATTVVAGAANTVAMEVGDLNGDGKIDAEDFKIAAARAKVIAAATADEAAKLGKEALQSDMAKDAAAGAAVGAAMAIPIPLVGPAAGAVIGAGLGIYKNITNKVAQKSKQTRGLMNEIYACHIIGNPPKRMRLHPWLKQ